MIFQNKMLANVLVVQLLGMACKFKERKENFSSCGYIFHSTQEMYQEVGCMCQDYFCILGVGDMFVYVVVNFLSQLIFIFPLFLGMIMNAKEFETKEI